MDIERIGRYEIIGKLGEGGMATVLLAKDSFMIRQVAIKLLPRLFLHDPSFKERFQREAILLAQLEHTAIVPVYDFGYHEEQPYMVNRYMRGGSLLDRISQHGALSLQESLSITSRISSALSTAHRKGIIHRDLKPANILFDESGLAFITDFGIAKLVESTSNLTGNTLVGTPAYMSPEQFTGVGEIDGRSDQYSLAIVLFEMLSVELPFKGDTTARLMKSHLLDAPPSIRTLRSDLPESIEPVIRKALAKKPADRFETMDAFQEALAAAVQGEPWVSKAAPTPPPAAKPAEIYQTNVLPDEKGQSPSPEPLKSDVFSTNILPPDELPVLSPEPHTKPIYDLTTNEPEKRSGKKTFRYRTLGVIGLVILGIIFISGIVIGVIALIKAQIPTYGNAENTAAQTPLPNATVISATNTPQVEFQQTATAATVFSVIADTAQAEATIPAGTAEVIPTATMEHPIGTPNYEVILSDGDYEISAAGNDRSTFDITTSFDDSDVFGKLTWKGIGDDAASSCLALELMSFPIGDSSVSVCHDLILCADGSYFLTEKDAANENLVLVEGTIPSSEQLEFEMLCMDDTLHYSVIAGDEVIRQAVHHLCWEWEHHWRFTVYNNTTFVVDNVQGIQYIY